MTQQSILLRRLVQHQLVFQTMQSAEQVVSWMGAVQAQDYYGALWSLGMRLQQRSEAHIEAAFNAGAVLRTHLMRPTWHFVLPEDIRWLLQLTAPRINAGNASRYRQLGLSSDVLARSATLIAEALRGGHVLNRTELAEQLNTAGIPTDGQRMAHILMYTELAGLICSGPRQDKQFTYALLEERVAPAASLSDEEALVELTRRYFTSHGPATIHDFVWWSGLTVTHTRQALATLGAEVLVETIDNQTYYSIAPSAPTKLDGSAMLLPTFDEYLVGYRGFGKAQSGGQESKSYAGFESTILLNGRVCGRWKRTLHKHHVAIQAVAFSSFSDAERDAIQNEAQAYADFLGLPMSLAFSD